MSYKPTGQTTIMTTRGEVLLLYGEMGLVTPTGKPAIKGFCLRTDKGIAININSSYPKEIQEKALRHEILHIDLGHLDDSNTMTIEECENEVDTAMGERL